MDGDFWTALNPTIYDLYITKNKSLEAVLHDLNQLPGVNIRKSQLEKQIKCWSFRKHLKKDEWQDLKEILRRRECRSKNSSVFLSGVLQSTKKVHKELLRYGTGRNLPVSNLSKTPPLPDGVRISTSLLAHTDFDAFAKLTIYHLSQSLRQQFQMNHFSDLRLDWNGKVHLSSEDVMSNSRLSKPASNGVFSMCEMILAADESISICWPTTTYTDIPVIIPVRLFRSWIWPQGSSSLLQLSLIFLVSNNLWPRKDEQSFPLWANFMEVFDIPMLESAFAAYCGFTPALLEQLFRYAIEISNFKILDWLLQRGRDPNQPLHADGRTTAITPLLRAVQLENFGIFERLMTAGADPNGWIMPNSFKFDHTLKKEAETPLRAALHAGNYFMSMQLLENGARCIGPYLGIKSELQIIVMQQSLDVAKPDLIEALIEAGADIGYIDRSGDNCLTDAITWSPWNCSVGQPVQVSEVTTDEDDGILELVKTLIRYGVPVTGDVLNDDHARCGRRALAKAICAENLALVKFFLDLGVEPNRFAIEFAAMCQNDDLARILFDRSYAPSFAPWVKHIELMRAILNEDIAHAEHLISTHTPFCLGCTADEEAVFKQPDDLDRFNYLPLLFEYGMSGRTRITEITPLSAACSRQSSHLIHLLLSAGAHLNSPKCSALGVAVSMGNCQIVEALLRKGADVNHFSDVVGIRGEGSPLHIATKKGDKAMVRLLMRHGAFIWDEEISVISSAAEHGDRELTSLILLAVKTDGFYFYPRIRSDMESIFDVAIRNQDVGTVKQLLHTGLSVNGPPERPTNLFAAVQAHDITMVQTLLQFGADVDDSLALAQAVLSNSLEMTQLLFEAQILRHGAAGKFYGVLALQMAIYIESNAIFDRLLAWGVDPSICFVYRGECWDWRMFICPKDEEFGKPDRQPQMGTNALGFAIQHRGDLAATFVSKLLAGHMRPNDMVRVGDTGYETALVYAILSRKDHIVQMLINAGADVNAVATCHKRRTALQASIETGQEQIVRMLLDAGANVRDEAGPWSGVTALQAAAIGGHIEIAHELLRRGADVNSKGSLSKGRTALEGAAEHGRFDMVQLLLNAGAQVHSPGTRQYERALKLAAEHDHRAICKLLEDHHAQTKTTWDNQKTPLFTNNYTWYPEQADMFSAATTDLLPRDNPTTEADSFDAIMPLSTDDLPYSSDLFEQQYTDDMELPSAFIPTEDWDLLIGNNMNDDFDNTGAEGPF